MPDYTMDTDVWDYIKQQTSFREKLLLVMRDNPQWKEFSSEDRLWTNFKYMEVFEPVGAVCLQPLPFEQKGAKEPADEPTKPYPGTGKPGRKGYDFDRRRAR
jgi:hypothetical protein